MGETKQEKLSIDSADYAPTTIRGSEISETGIEFIFNSLRPGMGEFGEFFIIKGEIDGKNHEILFSSQYFANGVKKHESALKGKKVLMRGFGEGVERKYKLDVL